MNNKTKNFISAAVAWLAAAWIFIFTMDLHSGAGGMIRPEFIPRVVAVLLLILGGGMFIQGLGTHVSEEEKKELAEKEAERALLPIIQRFTPTLTLILIFLFLLIVKPLGITISATLYLTLQMTLLSGKFGWKSWLKYFMIGLVSSAAILLIFCYGFLLKLPINKFGF